MKKRQPLELLVTDQSDLRVALELRLKRDKVAGIRVQQAFCLLRPEPLPVAADRYRNDLILLRSSASTTVSADLTEMSCSPERPPNITPTLVLILVYVRLIDAEAAREQGRYADVEHFAFLAVGLAHQDPNYGATLA
jgi:hypothetical protein